jgi:hypothetical protein
MTPAQEPHPMSSPTERPRGHGAGDRDSGHHGPGQESGSRHDRDRDAGQDRDRDLSSASGARRRPRYRWRAAVGVVLAVLVSGGIFWALTHRQYIDDRLTVWSFEASDTITGYAERSGMTEHGEFLFLASKPSVAEAAEFNTVCTNAEDGAGILGCYRPGPKTITLFDVTNDELDGIEEVVAAHEMLHAAWDRMSENDRAQLIPLLETEYDRLSADPAFLARMELYSHVATAEFENELHSIVGTEARGISAELTEHYARYFDDREALVDLHVASNRSTALAAELDALRSGIEADYASYNSGYDALNADVVDFNRRADSGSFASTRQFDRARTALLDRQAELDALFASIEQRRAEFDAGAVELESLNAKATTLNTSLNIVPRGVETAG